MCKEGSYDDNCNGCLPDWYDDELWIWWMTAGGCGIVAVSGGYAADNIDFLLGQVQVDVNALLGQEFGTQLTEDRDGTFVIGYSHGGLFACYAAWTRPEVHVPVFQVFLNSNLTF